MNDNTFHDLMRVTGQPGQEPPGVFWSARTAAASSSETGDELDNRILNRLDELAAIEARNQIARENLRAQESARAAGRQTIAAACELMEERLGEMPLPEASPVRSIPPTITSCPAVSLMDTGAVQRSTLRRRRFRLDAAWLCLAATTVIAGVWLLWWRGGR